MNSQTLQNTINSTYEQSLIRPSQKSDEEGFSAFLEFFCDKLEEGYSEEYLEEFLEKGLSDKKFRKYVLKRMSKEVEFDERLLDTDPNFEYLFEKYVEFKGK